MHMYVWSTCVCVCMCVWVPGVGQVHVAGDQHAQAVLAEKQVVSTGHDATLPGWLPSAQQLEALPVHCSSYKHMHTHTHTPNTHMHTHTPNTHIHAKYTHQTHTQIVAVIDMSLHSPFTEHHIKQQSLSWEYTHGVTYSIWVCVGI